MTGKGANGRRSTVGAGVGRILALHLAGPGLLRPQALLHGVGVFLEVVSGAVEGTEAGEQVVGQRMAVWLALERLAGPALAVAGSAVELLQAIDQPDLLLLEHFDVPGNLDTVYYILDV